MASSLRTLYPHEMDLFEAHLLRLEMEDRVLRFGARLKDEAIRGYCKRISALDSLIVGYVEEGEVRAAAHLALSGIFLPGEAEIGLSVEPGWRRQGIGHDLTLRATRLAANRGVDQVHLLCLRDNQAMQSIAHKLDGTITREDGYLDGAIRVLPATPLTYLQEGMERTESMMEVFWRPFAPGCGRS